MTLRLIMNPGSRSGRGRRLWKDWILTLRNQGIDHEIKQTTSLEHAETLAREASNGDTVVAVGGDGTINAVVNGLMQNNQPKINMGILYSGTSPDFCKFHNIPIEPDAAMDTLLKGKSSAIDVGKITYRTKENEDKTAYFVCSCNIGLGAAIARTANKLRRYFGDTVGTALASLYSFLICPRNDLQLTFENKKIDFEKNNNLSVVINPYLASGLKVNIPKKPDDGSLWILGLNKKNKYELMTLIPQYYSGDIAQNPNVLLAKTQAITITAHTQQELELDGDPHGFLPAKIELLPKALQLIKNG